MSKVALTVVIAAAVLLGAMHPADAQRILYGADVKYNTTYGGHQIRGGTIGQSDGRGTAAKKATKRAARHRSP